MHTPYQLKELYVCEQIWPVGERAANERAVMNAMLVSQAIAGGEGGATEAFKVYDSISGVIDPEKLKVHKKTPEQEAMEVKFMLRHMAGG